MTTTSTTEVQNESKLKTVCESCTGATVTVGVVSAVVTTLLVMVISVAVHIAIYQCFYKPLAQDHEVFSSGPRCQ